MSAWLEAAFTTHRPRALAALTRAFGDVDQAEEAFSDACLQALSSWQEGGAPDDPLAWLLTTARNKGIDRLRKAARRRKILETSVAPEMEEVQMPALPDPHTLRDDVLRLMFICCHPALARADQLALALRIVAGLSTVEIARAFLVKPKTMEQRLTRAKRAVAVTPVPFETPSPRERARRLGEVSLMVYLLFSEGWSASAGEQQIRKPFCDEAIRLARLLLDLFPGMSELAGLLALLLFQNARAPARLDGRGDLVALQDQDRTLWDRAQIAEAEAVLQKANRRGGAGSFVIQAEIAAHHARARRPEDTDWSAIEALYDALHAQAPTPVVALNRIAARVHTRGAAVALADLATLEEALSGYRWFHTMRAALLEETGDRAGARAAYDRALALSPTGPERRHMEARRAALEKSS